ncbi:site-specific DNA-methyltransferase [Microbacterium sp. JZ70]
MARIHELIKQLRASHPELGAEIAREVEVLSQRRAFGLNFERHTPEAVELPRRRVRVGDTVRVLPPRGQMPSSADQRLWKVRSIEGTGENRVAHLETRSATGDSESTVNAVADLVVITEFREPIYPGLESTGKVERGGDKPYHAVINAENYHALQALLFTHRGAVDAIYIDPPYNTGARDWKYNNDYVEGDDVYRHSKWLAFMERRLLLAKELLNPEDSVLIVTIDEKEYLRLGLLLEQVFPEARIQMISIQIKPGGVARDRMFARSDEYAFFVFVGESGPEKVALSDEWSARSGAVSVTENLYWQKMRRTGSSPLRSDSPGAFYPVLLDSDGVIVGAGDSLPLNQHPGDYVPPAGMTAVWPIRADGTEGRWQLGPDKCRAAISRGYVSRGKLRGAATTIYYLASGEQSKVESGQFAVVGRKTDGSIETVIATYEPTLIAPTQWRVAAHSANEHGSRMLPLLVPGRRFPFPKSLYAVEDSLRFFVGRKPDALIVDFFAGSGTTAHAVMRLNRQDGGRRRSISITNNEVSAEEQASLRREGLRPGDPDWEKWGICDYITKPRVKAAITGKTPDGEPIKGDYKFNDEFPMSDGLEENVEFFTLTYETPMRVQSHREFPRIAPLLWLRAGSRGRRIEDLSEGWDVAEAYGVLADIDKSDAFVQAMAASPEARIAFIVTDEDRFFEAIAHALPEEVETVRLYDSYLRNFEIDAMRGVR